MNILTVVIITGMLATVVVLVTGIGSMVRGGTFDQTHDEHFMFARVGMQALVFVLLLVALILANL